MNKTLSKCIRSKQVRHFVLRQKTLISAWNKMDRLLIKSKNIVCFCFGVYLGYCIVFWLSAYILRQHQEHCSKLITYSTFQKYLTVSHPVPKDNFLLVAVMTTRKYLKTRAEAIYRTWGQKVPGRIVFFIGGSEPYSGDLPVIILDDISENTYPPQKKSFAMLEYVATHFVNDYEWFMRADDDVFVKTDRLERLLRSVNSSKSLYLGQPGTGTQAETGKLGLHNSAPYCMGGPGVFFTKSALKKIRNHLKTCLQNAVTLHEDTEVGRCVQLHAGIACSNAFEFAQLFYQNYRNKSGSFTHRLGRPEERAITLHPIKHHPHMFRLDAYFSLSRLEKLRSKVRKLASKIKNLSKRLNNSGDDSESTSELLHSIYTGSSSEKQDAKKSSWDFISIRKVHSESRFQASILKSALQGKIISVRQALLSVNSDPRHQNYIVRPESYQRLSGGTMENIFHLNHPKRQKSVSIRTRQLYSDIQFQENETVKPPQVKIWMIVSVDRNSKTYSSFLSKLIRALERFEGNVVLHVIVHTDKQNDYKITKQQAEIFDKFSNKLEIRVILTSIRLSKPRVIALAQKYIPSDALLLLIDINFSFDVRFLNRVVSNTRLGKQAYYPVYFNRYSTKVICFDSNSCDLKNLGFEDHVGSWDVSGYKVLSIFKSDLANIHGLWSWTDSSETEDVQLFEKVLMSNLSVFRSPDPFLFHLYNEQVCDKSLTREKYKLCKNSQMNEYGSEMDIIKIAEKCRLITI